MRTKAFIGCASLICAALMVSTASATTADFTQVTPGTPITDQFPGLTFSLAGGPQTGTPVVDYAFAENMPQSLLNSTTNDYPTANILNIDFTNTASDVSFTFDNYGDNSFDNGSSYTAFASDGSLISTGSLADENSFSDIISVAGSNIAELQFNNGFGTDTSWLYGVGEVTYTSAAPEPFTWALMIVGLGMVGSTLRFIRRRGAPAAA